MEPKINWQPLVDGGANFKTKALNTQNPGQWRYDNTSLNKLFAGFLIWFGAFGAFICLITIIFFFMAVVPLAFMVIGIIWRRRMKQAIVFDFEAQAFWKGPKKFHPVNGNYDKVADFVKFEDIYAIQILAEVVKSVKSSGSHNHRNSSFGSDYYDSYEMNLILKDSSRVNVVDHANLNAIKREAYMIAGSLKIPVLVAEELRTID